MKQRNALLFMFFTFLLLTFASGVYANEGIKLVIHGELITSLDQEPYIDSNNRTMVPIRLVEKLGANVYWDDATRTISINKDQKVVKLTINSRIAYINDKEHLMDTQAVISSKNRTMVPLRFVAEAFDEEVYWDSKERIVVIGNRFKNDPELLKKFGIDPQAKVLIIDGPETSKTFFNYYYTACKEAGLTPFYVARSEGGWLKYNNELDFSELTAVLIYLEGTRAIGGRLTELFNYDYDILKETVEKEGKYQASFIADSGFRTFVFGAKDLKTLEELFKEFDFSQLFRK